MSAWKLFLPFMLFCKAVSSLDPCILTCQCLFISTANSSLTVDLGHVTHANLGFTVTSQENLCQNVSYHVQCQDKCEEKTLSITNGLDFGARINPYYNLGQVLCLEWPKVHPSNSLVLGPFLLASKFHCSFTNELHNVDRSNISVSKIATKSINCAKSLKSASKALFKLDKLAVFVCALTLFISLVNRGNHLC